MTAHMTPAEYRRRQGQSRKRGWSSAVQTTCQQGHRHPSKMEARVCDRLTLECEAKGWRLFRNVRLPLFALAPDEGGKPHYLTVDFGLCAGNELRRLVDAKDPRRVSRDWRRGAAACEATYGIQVEETDR